MDNKNIIIALNCAIFLYMFGVGLITPLLPSKILSFSGSAIQVGWLASAFACSYILAQIPLGVLADKFGYTLFIMLGFLTCGSAGCLFVTADSPFAVIAGRFVQGIGEAPLWALAPALLSIIVPQCKARIIGWYNACLHIGLTAGSAFYLISQGQLSDHLSFSIFVLLCIAAGILLIKSAHWKIAYRTDLSVKIDINSQNVLAILRDPKIFCVLLGIIVYGVGYGIYLTIIPTFLLKNGHLSQNSIGWLFIGFYIGISLSQLAGGYIADTKGRLLPMAAGLSIFSLGQILFPFSTTPIAIGFLTVASFGLGLFFIGSMATLNDYVGCNSKGLISAIFYVFWGSGYFAGPLILGYAGDQGWYILGFSSLGVLSLLISILLLITNCNIPARITKMID